MKACQSRINKCRTIKLFDIMADKPGPSAKADRQHVLLSHSDVASKLFSGLRLAAVSDVQPRVAEEQTCQKMKTADSMKEEEKVFSVSDKMFCSYCNTEFTDRDHQKSHYKTDWHRYNLKLKLRGQASINEDKFEDLVGGDISSISGSGSSSSEEEDETGSNQPHPSQGRRPALPRDVFRDPPLIPSSDTDDEASAHVEGIGRRHPRVFMRNSSGQLLSVYRCVVHGKKNQPEDQVQLLSMITQLPQQMKWIVLMTAGGHFAAAVFDRDLVLVHKTFHRYTVRAKRGTAQGLRDKQGSAPHSAGASLRRYNEAALGQDISELLSTWSEHIKTCDRIFLRAPSFNRSLFFGGKNPPLDKKDPRIRLVPFPTRRPTFSELKRVQTLLATVELYGEESTIHDHIKTSPKRPPQPLTKHTEKKQIAPDVHNDSEEDDNEEDSDLIDVTTVLETLNTDQLSPFECTKKPRRRKKKKAGKLPNLVKEEPSASKVTIEKAEKVLNDEEYQLRNELYTACKTCDVEKLSSLLAPLLMSDSRETTEQEIYCSGDTAADPSLISVASTELCTSNATAGSTVRVETTAEGTSTPSVTRPCRETLTDSVTSTVLSECPEVDNPASSLSNHTIPANCQADSSRLTHLEVRTSTQERAGVLSSALLNEPFGNSMKTLLHVAATQNFADGVSLLLNAGADPTVRDSQDKLPYLSASEKGTRNRFRLFMSKYPDKYDYSLAQIPGPVSVESMAKKKAREAERRKTANKARKDRLKEKKAEEAERAAEQQERDRFLKLSDREKRALAAERRFAGQLSSQSQKVPVLSRCWQCGEDITGKVPFEYYDFKFCSPKCLKEHKLSGKNR